jgi:hypothetical protein
MAIGTAPVDLKQLSVHPDCGLIMTIFHLDNDIQQPNMMYHPLRRLREADEKNIDLVIGIQFYLMRVTCSVFKFLLPNLRQIMQATK